MSLITINHYADAGAHDDERICQLLKTVIKETIMAVKQEILDAVAAEKEQVNARLAEQDAKIKDLEEKIANGEVVTADDLAEIRSAVSAIYTPAP